MVKKDTVSEKLDKIIELLETSINQKDRDFFMQKIQNKVLIDNLRESLQSDPVSLGILNLADGSHSYTELKDTVANEVGVAEITVRRRIAELADTGLISGIKIGREVFYQNTGIIEGG